MPTTSCFRAQNTFRAGLLTQIDAHLVVQCLVFRLLLKLFVNLILTLSMRGLLLAIALRMDGLTQEPKTGESWLLVVALGEGNGWNSCSFTFCYIFNRRKLTDFVGIKREKMPTISELQSRFTLYIWRIMSAIIDAHWLPRLRSRKLVKQETHSFRQM